ncbi:3'-5' exonuclease [Magnetococcales bacterium HHB-1]
MFKKILNPVWAFDAEWIPDPNAGKLLYKLPEETPDEDVFQKMWEEGGATEEDPTPFLKTVMCRVVTIAVVTRTVTQEGTTSLRLLSLPRALDDQDQIKEKSVVRTFLNAVGKRRPQLVGYNSLAADIRIMVQRAIVNGLTIPEFCRRPNKPWEGPDYFARGSDWNIDLQDVVTPGWGRGTPSLNEVATLSGIPGKMGVDGEQVPKLWLEGKLDEILAYNEYDALTTYLVWLRCAYTAGHFNEKAYLKEQKMLQTMVHHEIKENGKSYLEAYLEEWERLRKATGQAALD